MVRFRARAATAFELDRLFEQNLSRGVQIDEETARCHWIGDRMDYGLAVENLIWLRDRAREAATIQATQAPRALV